MSNRYWLEIPLASDESEWLLVDTPLNRIRNWHFHWLVPNGFLVIFENQNDMSQLISEFDDIYILQVYKTKLQVKFDRYLTDVDWIYSVASDLGIKIEIAMLTTISGMSPIWILKSKSRKKILLTNESCKMMLHYLENIPSGKWIDETGSIPNSFHVEFQTQKDMIAFLMGLGDHSSILKKYKRKLEIKFARITSDVTNMRETADRLNIDIKFKTHLSLMMW